MKSQRLEGIRVLVVDDHADVRELMRVVLEDAGARVQDAANADAAYAIVQRWKPDIIVSDLQMPDQDGHDLMKRIRGRTKEEGAQIPSIAITGYGPENRIAAFRAGYQSYMRKPINAEELIVTIASLTGRILGEV